jgi:hypothetical protein
MQCIWRSLAMLYRKHRCQDMPYTDANHHLAFRRLYFKHVVMNRRVQTYLAPTSSSIVQPLLLVVVAETSRTYRPELPGFPKRVEEDKNLGLLAEFLMTSKKNIFNTLLFVQRIRVRRLLTLHLYLTFTRSTCHAPQRSLLEMFSSKMSFIQTVQIDPLALQVPQRKDHAPL